MLEKLFTRWAHKKGLALVPETWQQDYITLHEENDELQVKLEEIIKEYDKLIAKCTAAISATQTTKNKKKKRDVKEK